jgi:hypothetical protein
LEVVVEGDSHFVPGRARQRGKNLVTINHVTFTEYFHPLNGSQGEYTVLLLYSPESFVSEFELCSKWPSDFVRASAIDLTSGRSQLFFGAGPLSR